MIRNRTYLFFSRQFFDYSSIVISFFLAVFFTHNPANILNMNEVNEILLLVLLLVTWTISSDSTKLYQEFRSRNFSYELTEVAKNIIVQSVVSILLIFLIKELPFSRLFVLYYILFLFSLIVIEKFLLRKVLIYFRKKGKNLRTILIIGAGKVGIKFFNSIKENPHFGYKVIGFLDDFGIQMLDGLYLGPIKKLNHLLKTKDIDDVIVALPNYATERIHEVIKTCELHGKIVRIIPDYFRFTSDKYRISMFAQFPVVTLKDDKVDQIGWRLIKRLFDIAFSSLVIVLIFSWLYPLIALLIKIDSMGPVLYKQERWGRGNKKFYVYKFRSMCCNAAVTDADGKYLQATQNDSRVTRIGKILRKTNIDELPQFINVFIGKMSVVGPRPHPTPLNLISTENIDQYLMRHLVKPGITGWAQVNGLRGETKDKKLMQKRVQYDIWYIENWSFLLDIQIIILTVWHMIKGDPNAY